MGYVVKGVRILVVLTFLVGMPILALPSVADWCERQIYPAAAPRVVAPASDTALRESSPAAQAVLATAIEPPANAETLDSLLTELRSLGAADYRLDEMQTDPPQFRMVAEFRSEGPLPKRWQYTANGENPQSAVREVIRQILADRAPQ